MSDRGLLFLFSLLMVIAGVGVAIWLLVTGQAGSVDGLFLMLSSLLVGLAFGLYAVFQVQKAMEAMKAPAAAPAKKPAAAAATPRPPALAGAEKAE